jgi:uncharacterized protein YcaQ
MMTKTQITINNKTARRFILTHHRLLDPRKMKGKSAILELIRHLNSIQFDTINVVGRNADLVLQSRIKDYQASILDEMLYKDRTLVDGWDKQASIYRVEDRPYFERFRNYMFNYPDRRYENVREAIPEIHERLEKDGPLSSLDFKNSEKVSWHWSHTSLARATLEFMWYTGKVGVDHRINTRRSFDLIERLIPHNILDQTDPNINDEDYQAWHVYRRIGSMGLTSLRSGEIWSGMVGIKAPERRNAIKRLLHEGKIVEINVEGHDKESLYARIEDAQTIESISRKRKIPNKTSFIAPLDNLIWNRKLINDLFDFKYIWEVYKPKAKREYGYYVLPVLYGDKFIARLDSKYDRKTSTMNVNNWWWEKDISADGEMIRSISECFTSFMKYLGAKRITFAKGIKFAKDLDLG